MGLTLDPLGLFCVDTNDDDEGEGDVVDSLVVDDGANDDGDDIGDDGIDGIGDNRSSLPSLPSSPPGVVSTPSTHIQTPPTSHSLPSNDGDGMMTKTIMMAQVTRWPAPSKVYWDASIHVRTLDLWLEPATPTLLNAFGDALGPCLPPPAEDDSGSPPMPWWDDFLFWVHGRCTIHVQVHLFHTSHITHSVILSYTLTYPTTP